MAFSQEAARPSCSQTISAMASAVRIIEAMDFSRRLDEDPFFEQIAQIDSRVVQLVVLV